MLTRLCRLCKGCARRAEAKAQQPPPAAASGGKKGKRKGKMKKKEEEKYATKLMFDVAMMKGVCREQCEGGSAM